MHHIIFDLDYTLVYSGDYQTIFTDMAKKVGVGQQEAEIFWQSHGGCPLREQIGEISGLDIDNPIVDQLEAYFWNQAKDAQFEELDGASYILEQLSSRGHLLFLSTGSNPDKMLSCLTQMGWHDYFFLAQGSSVDNPKGPSHYQNIAAHLDLPLNTLGETTAAVGDGAYDMRFARDHGVRHRLAYTPPGTDANHIELMIEEGATAQITNLRELLDIFER